MFKEGLEQTQEEKNLEKLLYQRIDQFNIDPNQQNSLKEYLNWIKRKDTATYNHSLRVGLTGALVAESLKIDPKPFFYAGLLHDLGKVAIDEEILQKTEKFTEQDMETMKSHPLYGYFLLKDDFPFSAEILLRHHYFGEKKYPQNLPELNFTASPETIKIIEKYAKILSIIDFYDAASTRTDRNSDITKKLKPAEIHQLLIKTYSDEDEKEIINHLYQQGVFDE
ncbi:MAG: HD domain-containing protein [Patescibacteria group bacterium]|nr:HD domain-containing protein [Patescibacteria group bacterium]MDD5164846.1 HD domain-containing protein [Patescibacteria group bacterium]MDD5534678.1 HD domain-containing protein [Patescibacteria group bacterium]